MERGWYAHLQSAFRRLNGSHVTEAQNSLLPATVAHAEDSCVLFQIIPQAFMISTHHGRVTAVEIPMNNNKNYLYLYLDIHRHFYISRYI